MAVSVAFSAVQQVVVKAVITDGPNSGYSDAITYTPAEFAALTNPQIRQQFADRYKAWQDMMSAPRVPPSAADLVSMVDTAVLNQDQALSQMDSATRLAYLQALQTRIAAKLAQG